MVELSGGYPRSVIIENVEIRSLWPTYPKFLNLSYLSQQYDMNTVLHLKDINMMMTFQLGMETCTISQVISNTEVIFYDYYEKYDNKTIKCEYK